MFSTITLTVLNGSLKGKEYVLRDRPTWTIGRSRDCDVVLPGGEEFCLVSRRHCQLEIDPPTVRDLGSMNGTFVNGEPIGMRPREEKPGGVPMVWPAYELFPGDELQVGTTVFRVGIEASVEDPSAHECIGCS
jgi:pSer/pThr/pTyr-binding forkhead associated (FHA) protein